MLALLEGFPQAPGPEFSIIPLVNCKPFEDLAGVNILMTEFVV